MKPRITAICAIVTFATCGDRAPAQFPDCAYITLFNPCPVSSETRGDCEPIIDPQVACQDCPPGAGAWWVVNNRKDGEAKVTIRVTLWDRALGTSTFTDQALTLALGETRPLGCSLPAPQPHYTWSIERRTKSELRALFVRREKRSRITWTETFVICQASESRWMSSGNMSERTEAD